MTNPPKSNVQCRPFFESTGHILLQKKVHQTAQMKCRQLARFKQFFLGLHGVVCVKIDKHVKMGTSRNIAKGVSLELFVYLEG